MNLGESLTCVSCSFMCMSQQRLQAAFLLGISEGGRLAVCSSPHQKSKLESWCGEPISTMCVKKSTEARGAHRRKL